MKKSDNISDILRHVPCKEAKHLFSDTPAITKLLDLPSNSGKYADEVVDAFKRVADSDSLGLFESFIKNNNFKDVADYEKRYTKIISNVSEFQDELMLVIKNADERTALKIAEFASDYGKGVIGAVDKCGYDNIYKITHYISESGVSGKVASELFEALSKHGDTLIKAVEKCGPKNIENIVEILSKINPNQVDAVVDLLVHHGDDMVRAIKNCGTDKIDLIEELIKSGEKYNLGDVLFICRNSSQELVWLEIGGKSSGFMHILAHHPLEQFSEFGVKSETDLQKLLLYTISEYIPVGKYGQGGTAYQIGNRYLCAVISSNGYLVDTYDITSKMKKIIFY